MKMFYGEAGDSKAPTILPLHGFPSSSHMFRVPTPLLADRDHVIAPDLPGFGFTEAPQRTELKHTFENLASVIDTFTHNIGLDRYAIYVFGYGAPVGFRLALEHPERITSIVSQNGNAYEEGLSDGRTRCRNIGRSRPTSIMPPFTRFLRLKPPNFSVCTE